MAWVRKRRRGTAIVETEDEILVTAGRSKIFLLPEGGVDKDAARTKAAMLELREETGLKPYHAKYLLGMLAMYTNHTDMDIFKIIIQSV